MMFLANKLEQIIGNGLITPGSNSGINNRTFITAFLVTSSLFLITALGFGIYAGYLWLNFYYPPHVAYLGTAGIMMSAALICALMALGIFYSRIVFYNRLKSKITHDLQQTLDYAEHELNEHIQNNPKSALLIALMSGYATGETLTR